MALFRSPITALRDTPISSTLIVLISLYSWWLGYLIIHVTSKLPPARIVGYRGPLSVFTLATWGHLFLVAGTLIFLRLFIPLQHKNLSLGMHMIGMCVSFAWAVAFDLGPLSTGQAAYTFEAVIIFGSPFMVNVIERRYGQRRPPLT